MKQNGALKPIGTREWKRCDEEHEELWEVTRYSIDNHHEVWELVMPRRKRYRKLVMEHEVLIAQAVAQERDYYDKIRRDRINGKIK